VLFAENIPIEPDVVSTAVGKCLFLIKSILKYIYNLKIPLVVLMNTNNRRFFL